MELLSIKKLSATGMAIAAISSSSAFGAVTIDLKDQWSSSLGLGNSLSFSAGGIGVTVYGFGETGANGWLEPSEVQSFLSGIGSCNADEGPRGGPNGDPDNNCVSGQHEVDTIGADELILFSFDQSVNLESITVDPFDQNPDGPDGDPNDRDINYWVGNGAVPDLSSSALSDLDTLFGAGTFIDGSESFDPITHLLSGSGNLLLVTGNYLSDNCVITGPGEICDSWKIADVTVSAIPVPAAAWLFVSAIAGLAGIRKAKA
ncbi:MAG: VPLPA-CTERM sorting domain-containing protein [Gammaproteobacteria bacterium]|nr:VPLPA-CTERM sorting domain-containing protein [Gammaproteobacteria bacterium]